MSEPGFKDRAALRGRLLEMRAEIIKAMQCDGIESGWLLQLAGIAAALDAIEEDGR